MHIDAHRTPWTLSGHNGMRRLRTTLAVSALSTGLLAGCTRTEVRHVPEYHAIVCPQQAPARLCPVKPADPSGPVNIYTAIQHAVDLGEWGDCHAARDADWQQLLTDCHEPR